MPDFDMSIGFWIILVSLFLLVNSNIIYPLLIQVLASFAKNPETTDKLPKISVLIAAHNEEKVIAERIDNLFASDFPAENFEVLIGSDCSTDNTNTILKSCAEKYPRLRLFLFEERSGKAGVLNKLVPQASNEVLVFSDANTVFEKDVLKVLASHYANANVGGVCGKLVLTDTKTIRQASVEERPYWEFETKIKHAEGKLGVLIGANGGNFSIRKSLYKPIPRGKAITDDFFISVSVLEQGYASVFTDKAVAHEEVGRTNDIEFSRKVRFAATNYQTLFSLPGLLFNKNLLISYAFWSHKVIRWFQPHFLLVILFTCLMIAGYHPVTDYLLYIQILFYGLALAGWTLAKSGKRIRVFSYPYFFTMTNYAFLKGFIRFLRGRHSLIWKSTER